MSNVTKTLFFAMVFFLHAGTGSAEHLREELFRKNSLLSGPVTEMLSLINHARSEGRTCGDTRYSAAGPLKWDDRLAAAALAHAEDMAINNYFSHTSMNGTSFSGWVKRTGYLYRRIGENIAATTDVQDVVALWLGSPDHCANLMDGDFTEMGGAFALGRSEKWETRWVQMLGKRQ